MTYYLLGLEKKLKMIIQKGEYLSNSNIQVYGESSRILHRPHAPRELYPTNIDE
jgi:hypothetical protein